MATVSKVISVDFSSGVDVGTFHTELAALSLASTVFQYVTADIGADSCDMEFTLAPSVPDIVLIDGAVASHTNTPLPVVTELDVVNDPQGGDLSGNLPDCDVIAVTANSVRYPTTAFVEGEFLTINAGNLTSASIAVGDEFVKVTGADTTARYLNDKIVAGDGISSIVLNPSADEDLSLGLAYGTPVNIGSANNAGADDTATVRRDHVHAHGAQGGGSQHTDATISSSGFMSAADKLAIDTLSADSSLAVFDHFMSSNTDSDEIGALGWRLSAAGAGNDLDVTAVGGHPGIMVLSAGTSNMGRVALHLGGDSQPGTMIIGGAADISFEALIHYETSIGVSDLEMTQIGLGVEVGSTGELSNGVYIRFNPAVSNAFTIVSASAGVRTESTGTTTVLIHTWYRVGFVISDPSGSPSIQMYVNGTAEGSPITTNIPVVSLAPMTKIDSAGGAVSPQLYVDYFQVKQDNDLED